VDTGAVERLGTGASYVMDVENDVWVTMNHGGNGGKIRVDREVVADVRTPYGQLSTDGRWLVVDDAPVAQSVLPVAMFDTATGEERPTGLPTDVLVEGFWPGPGGLIVYAVAESPDGPVDLVSCDPETAVCSTVVAHAADHPPLVLPEDYFSAELVQ
jgi:hypothetical protein